MSGLSIADPTPAPAPRVDGRSLRAARTRGRILAAARDLVTRHKQWPRVVDIAARAGVSTRSVFQHFDDVHSLMREALTSDAIEHIAEGLRALPDRELVEAMLSGRMPEGAL